MVEQQRRRGLWNLRRSGNGHFGYTRLRGWLGMNLLWIKAFLFSLYPLCATRFCGCGLGGKGRVRTALFAVIGSHCTRRIPRADLTTGNAFAELGDESMLALSVTKQG